MHCTACRAALHADGSYPIASDPGIPVRRYGTMPRLEEESTWDVEALVRAPAACTSALTLNAAGPRTIAEYGGTAVLVAGMAAAALAGWVLYLT